MKSKKWLAALLLLALALPGAGVAEEELAMSDVENMTAPGVLPIVTEPVTITIAIESNSTVTDYEDNAWEDVGWKSKLASISKLCCFPRKILPKRWN